VLEPRLIVTDEQRAETLAALGLQAPRARLLAIAPGAEYGPAKRWPTRHFAALAAAKRAQGWQVWVFGSPGDRDAAAEIPAEENLAGRTSLDQAVALLSLADAVVSNDSGLMHVAAALGRPQVALFGPSDPLRTGPTMPRPMCCASASNAAPATSGSAPWGTTAASRI
jgi:lipopolysaccharide heptosyltransferase II